MNDISLADYLPDLQIIWDALIQRDQLPNMADVILIGGCRDLGLADRAAELYHAKVVPLIVVSGYQPKTLNITEAELLASRCMELGVPSSAIVLEKEASNTGDNIIFGAKVIGDIIPGVKSVILIHEPYMTLRFLATAEAQWPSPQPKFYVTCQSISLEDYFKVMGVQDTVWKILGDLKRVDGYVAKGFQTYKSIPNEARAAFDRIVASGFEVR